MFDTKKNIKEKWWVILLFAIFIFSFILDMYILTRYNLSYGRDGPFYDLQVLNIFQTGFTSSNDPPLAYYMLTPFVMISGNSFLGIKIGMSLIGSLLIFPAYFLTEIFSKKINMESKVPALLSAFLMTINPFYFGMIGDFMQNLVGVFFLMLLLYFAVKWFEDTKKWKKYGVITIILLICSIFTHIYTGILAVVLFVSLLLFNFGFKTFKTGKIHLFDLKILGLLGVLIVGGLAVLFAVYPVMFSKFTTVLSFVNSSSTGGGSDLGRGGTGNPLIFFTLPFLLGVFATLTILYNGLKSKKDIKEAIISKKTYLAWLYIVMAAVLVILSVSPSIDSQYKGRFIMLAFVPVALMVPLGLKYIENLISKKYPSKNMAKITIVSTIAVLFAFSAFYSASGEFSSMGPSISTEQYNELVKLKGSIDNNTIVVVGDYHTGYWVQYVLGTQISTGNVSDVQQQYPNQTVYAISLTEDMQKGFGGNYQYTWNLLFPYSFPLGGLSLGNSGSKPNDMQGGLNDTVKNNMTPPSEGLRNRTMFNMSGSPPSGNFTPPGGNRTSGNAFNGNIRGNPGGNNRDQDYSSYGTLIYSGNYIKVYKIS